MIAITPTFRKTLLAAGVLLIFGAIGWGAWTLTRPQGPGAGFVSGNGRIEATEIDIATKYPGRIVEISVREGDFVHAGQVLAQMQVDTLNAQRDEARAQQQQALTAVASAEAQVGMRESDLTAVKALVTQRESELDNAKRRLARLQTLSREGMAPLQQLDDNQAAVRNAQAVLAAAQAQVKTASAAVLAAKAQVTGARATVTALEATLARIQADIRDSQLKAPRDGRVQ
jgi:HlyD family secretion protein